ncbi:MAG: hypothetical protein JRH19_23530 [Deltaproteobacteria bacterium]|nr:hypothetical protein [Deltaproteobacteria bacterium]
MYVSRLVTVGLVLLAFTVLSSSESLAGKALYKGSWIAESFGNDLVDIGTEASEYFEVLGIPAGHNCHPKAPLCKIESTPVTTTGTPEAPGDPGTIWNPLGPACRPLLVTEPRPPKGFTKTPGGLFCTGDPDENPAPDNVPPCDKTPPLYRNAHFFTAGGLPDNATCTDGQTVNLGQTNVYLAPGDPQRGILMKGAPVSGYGQATTAGDSFTLPAALPGTVNPGAHPAGMRRTTLGSFIGEGPYLYSYTYANLWNDEGTFGPGKGFFSLLAIPATVQFTEQAQGTTVQTVKVTRGANRFGGVMKLLGSYTNKVCYFYADGCGLGYGDWGYENIGAAGYKDAGVVTGSWTTAFTQTYYNTALGTVAKYNVIEQRFPWTTGTVTVHATKRGPNKTHERREGFDKRVGGIGTVQLVSPIITQWLAQSAAAVKMETGGIAVMQIEFIPETGVLLGLVCGLSLLVALDRRRP